MSSAGTLPVYSTKSGNRKARHGFFASSFADSSVDLEKSAGLSSSIVPSPTSTIPVELSLREADTPEDLSSLGSHDLTAQANYSARLIESPFLTLLARDRHRHLIPSLTT